VPSLPIRYDEGCPYKGQGWTMAPVARFASLLEKLVTDQPWKAP